MRESGPERARGRDFRLGWQGAPASRIAGRAEVIFQGCDTSHLQN